MIGRWAKKRKGGAVKFRSSLMSRYLLLIIAAFLFVPILFPLLSVAYIVADYAVRGTPEQPKYGRASEIEWNWHNEASKLDASSGQGEAAVEKRLQELKRKYVEASLFWVDADGRSRLQLPGGQQLPDQWSPAESIRFMKNNSNGDPFTVVAFIGKDNSGPAFMVIQLPRELLHTREALSAAPLFIGIVSIMFFALLLFSLLFFIRLRRRLLRLETAMSVGDSEAQTGRSIPAPVKVTKPDEIGQLELAFNRMITQLEDSQRREREEEDLRKRLISNLSHDLRTPLTVVNSHLYMLRKEELSAAGQASIRLMEGKIEGLGQLIDNLLAYTLMASGRYPLTLAPHDVIRLVRESAAAWYPVWEKEGIEADISLPEQSLVWNVDKAGFRRLLDNLFQNVVRHAAEGRYIGLFAELYNGSMSLVIEDRGPGIESPSELKGAGIGLAIVDHLAAEMGLGWHAEAGKDGNGTRIFLNQGDNGRYSN
ncbi:HAMP domain-containing sensor histidine kinase [Paenibacillus sp. NEAU-GSW1]|uniref:HAMP domain-containing sensor histidine kinase n=1 Tax=Paenibacillus sp. NEAU-GSW1 TaxID=2682486 RepID=UPI0012E304AA|nr:HAMP domain-containing sensor histidine kinase [Paenibacillus sp. NEAU-GSW1]MUT66106.1 HAMP domain-containing protein [Paenibacillus sp. NEAU-GSW1]